MKHQFISIIPLLLVALICALYAAPHVSFANIPMILLSPDEGGGFGPSGSEVQPGVPSTSETQEEPENKEGVEEKPDIQEFAKQQAERGERDREAGTPVPDLPATPVNLAKFQEERAKTEQENQETAERKKSQQFDAQNPAAPTE